MDLLSRRVSRSGATIDLTGREFELLEYLLRHKNEVVTRDMIAATSGRRRPGRHPDHRRVHEPFEKRSSSVTAGR